MNSWSPLGRLRCRVDQVKCWFSHPSVRSSLRNHGLILDSFLTYAASDLSEFPLIPLSSLTCGTWTPCNWSHYSAHLHQRDAFQDPGQILSSLALTLCLLVFTFNFLTLYWSMVSEQYCDSFRCPAEWLSHAYTCIHSPPNSITSRLSHDIEQSSLCYTIGASCL